MTDNFNRFDNVIIMTSHAHTFDHLKDRCIVKAPLEQHCPTFKKIATFFIITFLDGNKTRKMLSILSFTIYIQFKWVCIFLLKSRIIYLNVAYNTASIQKYVNSKNLHCHHI